MCRYRHHFFSFITVIDYYQCDLIITHTICLINNYNTNTNMETYSHRVTNSKRF